MSSDGQQGQKSSDGPDTAGLEIPTERLTKDALRCLIEEYVTREGTDYGEVAHTLDQKVESVRAELRNGRAMILFDPETESCTIAIRE